MMTSIGNKFSALSIDVENPFDQVKKKSRPIKKKQPKKDQYKDKKHDGDQKNFKEIALIKEVPAVKDKIIITDASKNDAKKSDRQTSNNAPRTSKKVDIKIISGDSDTKKIGKEKQVTFESYHGNQQDEDGQEKDDRGVRGRSTYKRMIVNRGKVYDRHGGPKAHDKAVEKNQGHGAYNWGEKNTQDDLADDSLLVKKETSDEKVFKQSAAKIDNEPSVEVPQYTLEQYKEMLRDSKVDPLSWSSGVGNVESKETEEKFDLRQYEYRRQGERGTPTRGSGRGRGTRSERGGRGRTEYSQRGRGRGDIQQRRGGKIPVDVKIDDVNDFPTL